MPLLGALQNQQAQLERLNSLREKLLRAATNQPKRPKRLRLRTGAIQAAVVEVLAAASEPMQVRDIHAAAEKLLEERLSADSVNSCLSTGVKGKSPLFKRLTRGRYVLP